MSSDVLEIYFMCGLLKMGGIISKHIFTILIVHRKWKIIDWWNSIVTKTKDSSFNHMVSASKTQLSRRHQLINTPYLSTLGCEWTELK